MAKIYKLVQPDGQYAKACIWLAQLDRGLSALEEAEFQVWLAEDERNQRCLLEVADMDDRMQFLSRLADLFPEPIEHNSRRLWAPASIAASIAVCFIVGWLTVLSMDTNSVDSLLGEKRYETSVGEQSSIILSDGSTLILNTDSLVRVRFFEQKRILVLDRGEVHVNVAHEQARPLYVYAGDKVVQAVGTAFNIQIKENDQVELIVTEGKVVVGVSNQSVGNVNLTNLKKQLTLIAQHEVVAGEQVLLGTESEQVEKIDPTEINVKLSWHGGNLMFRGESLEEAITEISRYTEVEFVLQDEVLKKIRVAGMFKAGDVDGLLATLEKNFNVITQKVSEDKVVLLSR